MPGPRFLAPLSCQSQLRNESHAGHEGDEVRSPAAGPAGVGWFWNSRVRSRGWPALSPGASGIVMVSTKPGSLAAVALWMSWRLPRMTVKGVLQGFSRTDGNDALSLAVAPSFYLPHTRKTISG